jgi:hypothetical protein
MERHHRPALRPLHVRLKYVFLVIDVTNRTFGPIFHRNEFGSYEVCIADLTLAPGETILEAWNDHVRPFVEPRFRDYSFVFYTKVGDIYVVVVSQPLALMPTDMAYLNHTYSYATGIDATGPIKLRRFTDEALQLWHALLPLVQRFMLQPLHFGYL